jgi:hypothetical protein
MADLSIQEYRRKDGDHVQKITGGHKTVGPAENRKTQKNGERIL